MDKIRILVIDDEILIRTALQGILTSHGFEVRVCETGLKALTLLAKEFFDVVLLDLKLPDYDGLELLKEIKALTPDTGVIIITAYAEVKSAVQAIKDGAFDYLAKPFQEEELLIALEKFFKFKRLERELELLKERIPAEKLTVELIGESKIIKELKQKIEIIARSDVPALIYGESGTGKELVADLIHKLSSRRDGPYIKINCTAIPDTLFEAELFGFDKGAFTGATESKKGKLELANGGTILLDEIGDLPLNIQPKLLRVLETNSFYPLGSKREVKVNTRYLFTTNRDLKKLVEEGKFRDDLYYRLNVIPLKIPPLRERKEDIPSLIRYFLNYFAQKHGRPIPQISQEAYMFFLSYDYPGNVRELKHLIERAILLSQNNLITLHDLPEELLPKNREIHPAHDYKRCRALLEREIILQTLKECKGKKSEAARRLGISRKTLWQKLKNFESH
ncbi:chemotaxis protein CheY [Caldimicrobium thiodismutans]|jgi:DNA-binding NtrC family response regulator|uniref:Chemotaxis protein CheY n=1 Tax=Caldimicrobium thiodismutans TaxID=1653476 RepID=A0A0U4N3J5_9BACT|nr:sigma-54 dependent transcriptional regulator [Caldimicrobium thiodismutans]BAU23862.1 chemotaxis protein CheY [Caldimicrobium thiodismutans]